MNYYNEAVLLLINIMCIKAMSPFFVQYNFTFICEVMTVFDMYFHS